MKRLKGYHMSITHKVIIYFVVFTLIIMTFIGIGVRYILPDYYLNYQLDRIKEKTVEIKILYSNNDIDGIYTTFDELQKAVGGELYTADSSGIMRGIGKGKGMNSQMKNEAVFIPDGDITEYTYKNKINLDIYLFALNIDGEYLVYEVSIQSLNNAVGVMSQFIWILLFIALLLSVAVSIIFAGSITSPIKKLNVLAKQMKNKQVDDKIIIHQKDEIGQLNESLNRLYEELLANIYRLESELEKERNTEKLKKQFLAQATHELKTPIAVIRGYAELLDDGMYKDEDEREQYIKNIYNETDAIGHVITDVLEYSKMETGNYKIQKQMTDITAFLHRFEVQYAPIVKSNGLMFTVEYPLENRSINIDPPRMEQVVKNLLFNGIEHAKSRIDIKVIFLDEKIKIQVYNDGNPIEKEDLPYLFDSFYKKKGKKTGTGLGLAIVKQIVLLHQGEYRVENQLDGVNFIVVV